MGWYVLFPVAWAELSECWRLPARQRALIDIAGVFLQAQLVFLLMMGFLAGGHALLLTSAVGASVSILWNLNPLLRLDGYWLLSDLLGRSNLRADARTALTELWQRHAPMSLRSRIPAASPRSGLNQSLALLLAGYALACAGVFALVLMLAAQQLWHGLLQELPERVAAIVAAAPAGIGWTDALVLVGALLWKGLLLALIARYLGGLFLRGWRRLGAMSWSWATQRLRTSLPSRPNVHRDRDRG